RQSADFVDSFLFEIQEGYCDYYSTAMVVMARTLGLPARWVKGYVPGESSNEFIFEQFLPGDEIDSTVPRRSRCAIPMRIPGSRCISRDTAGFRSSRRQDFRCRSSM